jgi:hypothetical protein
LRELIITPVQLTSKTERVSSAEGIVYSTDPHVAFDEHENRYVVKGENDRGVVTAEIVGYIFARECGISVPEFSLGVFANNGETVFASQIVDGLRDVRSHIRRNRLTNPEALPKTLVLDVLLANKDRNAGNFVGRHIDGQPSRLELIAIDFEKAATIRAESPIVEVSSIEPRKLWPSGELGAVCHTVFPFGSEIYSAFEWISQTVVEQIITLATEATGWGIEKRESMCKVILSRASKLEALVTEAAK